MVSFSLDAEFTPDELAAGRQEEREGVWWQDASGSIAGDGRPLDQFHTDRLIEHELMMSCSDVGELERILPARHRKIHMPKLNRYGMPEHDEEYLWGIAQRGGIHGDPLIRSIARRAFGARDVGWFDQPICACGHERDFHGPRSPPHAGYRCVGCGTCTFSRERVDELYLPCACPGSWFMDPEQGTINKDRAGHAFGAHRYLNGASRAIERARRTISGGPVRHAPSCGMSWAT